LKRKLLTLVQSPAASKKKWLLTLAVCTTCLMAVVPSAFAGKEGVFISSDTYFTLENAAFTAGNDSTSMQFVVKMHNGSGQDVDFNGYGVRIVDGQGNPFPAQLTSKQNARVNPGKDQEFRFFSEMPAGETPDQLKVNLYAWDDSQPTFMRSIGDLSVSAAAPSQTDTSQQILISMNDIDPSFSKEAQITARLGRSYLVADNGSAYMYTDLYTQNGGTTSFQIPSSLQFRAKGPDGLTFPGSLVEGNQEALLPNRLTRLTIRAAVPDNFSIDQSKIETFHVNSSEELVLGILPISDTAVRTALGKEQPYSLYGTDNGLQIVAERAIAVKQTTGTLLQTTIKIRNESDKTTTLPILSAFYQFGTGSMEASQEQSVKTGFLSPSQTATYQYSVLLPDGIDPKTASLALFEASTGTTVNTSGSSGSSAAASTGGSTSGSSNSGTNGAVTTNNSSTNASTTGTNANPSGSNGSSTSSNTAASGAATGGSSGSTGGGTNAAASSGSSTSTKNSAGKRPVMVVDLSAVEQASNAYNQVKPYTFAQPLTFATNGWLDSNVEVSLMELHMHENTDLGYKTAVAKYKITNRGSSTLPLPALGTELINDQGLAFSGVRQSSAAEQIMPNTSYVVSYSYLLPAAETGAQLALNIFDPKSTAANKLSVGTFQVAVQSESIDKKISFYPFEVSFDSYALTTLYSSNAYNYVLNLDLTVNRMETVIVDQNFSQMEFELVDGLGRSLGSQTMSFTGAQKLITGSQKVTFSNIKTEQFETGLTINVYETINTPSGLAKRLVKQLKQ
jgi:hypothetical protein